MSSNDIFGYVSVIFHDISCTQRSRGIQLLEKTYNNLGNEKKIIITTEKDAARLEHSNMITDELKSSIYVLPIKVKILFDKEEDFKKQILDYVRKNTTNNKLSKDPIK
mgnify:CR=1 FL=1